MSTQTVFVKAGATSQTIDVWLPQKAAATSPGDPITGLAYNTSSFTAYYRNGATGTLTAITLATQTVGGAYSSGGFVEVSSTNAPGLYRFDIPDAAIPASVGVRSSITFNGAANQATHTVWLVGSPAVDATSISGTAQTARDIGASVLLSAGTGTGQLDFTSGVVKANATQWLGGTIPAVNVTGVPLVDAKYLLGTVFATPATAGVLDANVKNIANAAVSTSTAQLGVNVVNFGGSAGTFASGVPAVNTSYIDGTALNGGVGMIRGIGIVDKGTAQAATGTTLQLRSAAAFADSELIGATIVITSATAGAGQRRIITAYTGSTDTATVDAWTTTPTGTITYEIYGSPPGASGLPSPVNLTQILGTAVSTPATAGILDTNVKNMNNVAATAITTIKAVQGLATDGVVPTVTNLTNAPSAGDFTATMKTSIGTAVAASAVASVTGNVGGNVVGTVAGVTPLSATSANATRYQKNTGSQKVFFTLVDSTDHVTRKTGITVTATRSLDGAAFGAASGSVTEIGNGVYYLTPSAGDINADDVVYKFTGTACDQVEIAVATY